MEKQKRWQLFVIIAVILLTIYNILPTVFYYTKPLRHPIGEKEAAQVATGIAGRVNALEGDAEQWIQAFSKNLGVTAKKIELSETDPRLIQVTFANSSDAAIFARHLPRAGTLIPFVPSQLELAASAAAAPDNITVQRMIGVHFPQDQVAHYFKYSPKVDANGHTTPFYQGLVFDRLMPLILAIAGESETAHQLNRAIANPKDAVSEEILISLSRQIVEFDKAFGSKSEVTKRYWSSFTQSDIKDKEKTIKTLSSQLEALSSQITAQRTNIIQEQKQLKEKGQFLNPAKEQELKILASNRQTVDAAKVIVEKNSDVFESGAVPLSAENVITLLKDGSQKLDPSTKVQTIDIKNRNPFIAQIKIDWANDEVMFILQKDLNTLLKQESVSESEVYKAEKVNQLLINQIASLSRLTDESISPDGNQYVIDLNQLTNSSSVLSLDLGVVAATQAKTIKEHIQNDWNPQSPDFSSKAFPILSYEEYKKLPASEKKLGLVIYAPAAESSLPPEGFRSSSIYILARGLQPLVQQYSQSPNSAEAKAFGEDFEALKNMLQQEGFFGYPATAYDLPGEFKQDYIFELDDYYNPLLQATRENFTVHGSKRYAVLEFTDVEQRLLTLNKIEDSIHEDLLKWRDAYHAAQVDLNLDAKYDVPPPAKNVYWDNFKLSFKKYFRGDNRKILRWGLDLSGGKTVRIGLKDRNNRKVSNPEDLREGVNELYKRVNKMGVSEVGIRIEGSNIVLDFPGSQGLTAAELIKASSMTFHVVNEKFSTKNASLATTVNQFLQEVWNEAVVTNRKDSESVNQIAWQHLGGSADPLRQDVPQSEAARILSENGLKLASPANSTISSAFDDSTSAIAMHRGDSFTEWEGQSHPLLIVFRNYALEGSMLDNVSVGYEPSKGNILSFGVKGSGISPDGNSIDPRDDFYSWTSQFAQEKIVGTPKETFSRGDGWRMAVVLNGSVISSPTLTSPLRDQAMISGRFSQREINQLAADLKAGSLSFTPQILSEQNVSPELGKEERTKGITAAFIATLIVVISMVIYYRFAGVVASVAVIFNLLIMWGVLQNLDAALTLPGIAGIILTIGMAIDANVLVYERIREEYALSKRLPSAVQAGYRKAFSAIIDSNLTTIIAALVLLQFDSGPIKAFAVMLIIGIISSMFTALFMTRYFFAGWVQNPTHKTLNMSNLIGKTSIDFLSKTKAAIIISAIVVVAGGYLFFAERNTIFGMDFTGGYALTVELESTPSDNYRVDAENAILSHGASQGDVQVRELNTPQSLRIQLGMTMEQQGHPYYGLPLQNENRNVGYAYEQNPRILWVVNALSESGLQIKKSQLPTLEQNWSEMSGQLSDTMRNSALIGMAVALLGILLYITIRFEFNYALSAIIGLIHDVVITLGIMALLHAIGIHIQIDLQVVAAIMTIIGYSLNDTIIIFDRIREDIRLMRKVKFADVVNHALNATLSRTIMTSGTTLLVLLALVFLGGSSIFDFALVMTIGVVVGTLSSLFIAAPLMLYFHQRDVSKQEGESKTPVARIRTSNG